jgi:RNA polymerase sigma-70 factor (ECF subfamily)
MKIWENRGIIDHERSPNAYLFTIAKNCALDVLRQKARRLLFEKQLIDNFKVSEDGEAPIIDEDLKRYINNLITHIPERRREIFKLRYEKQLSYKEIAEKLGISENTVHSQISHALRYLREQLGKELWTVTFSLITFFSVLKI